MAQTHFGYQTVDEADKARHVRGVFDSVATRYDLMNDVLSLGMHRVWKAYTVGVAAIQPGMRVLDIAGGTGDLARAFAARVGEQGCVVLTDINETMLRTGRDRMLDQGRVIPTAACDAEHMPFADGSFDLASVAFEPVLHSTGRARFALLARLLGAAALVIAVLALYRFGAAGVAWAVAVGGVVSYLGLGLAAWRSLRGGLG